MVIPDAVPKDAVFGGFPQFGSSFGDVLLNKVFERIAKPSGNVIVT